MEREILKYGWRKMKKEQPIDRNTLQELLNDVNFDSNSLNDFEKDAFDGWKEAGIAPDKGMLHLDKRFKVNKRISSTFKLSIGLITVATIVSILLLFNQTPTTLKPRESDKLAVTIEQTDIQLPESIDTLTALPKQEQISVEEIKSVQKGTNPTTEKPFEFPADFILSQELIEPLPASIETPEVALSKQKSAKEVYLNQLKAIDYSTYRTKPTVQIEQIILNGVPANFEDESAIHDEPQTKMVAIPYMDYLEKTLLYINKGRWKQGLSRLEEILKAYPDDVNARFYAGWCYYNLQQYQEAATNFSACLQLEFSNFNEESMWYLAQSRLANGEKNAAKELLQNIREQKGYYAKQAEKALKELK
jgi:TolA-binding protein